MFKANQSVSQRYLNEKDKLFGFISWKDFTCKFMAPLIIGGAYSNLSDNSLFTLVIATGVTGLSIFILELFGSKKWQYKVISLILCPKTVSVSHKDLRQWGKHDY
jgi:hypothetical protein